MDISLYKISAKGRSERIADNKGEFSSKSIVEGILSLMDRQYFKCCGWRKHLVEEQRQR